MDRLKDLFKRKLFRTYIISYLLLLIIPAVICLTAYVISLTVISEYLSDIASASVRQSSTRIDAILSEVRSSGRVVSTYIEIRECAKISLSENPQLRYKLIMSHNNLAVIEQSEYVENAYFYFPKEKTIIGSGGVFHDDHAKRFLLTELGINPDELFYTSNNVAGSYYLQGIDEQRDTPVIYLVVSILEHNSFSVGGYLIIKIDMGIIFQIMQESSYNESSAYLISEKSNMYISEDGVANAWQNSDAQLYLQSDEIVTESCESQIGKLTFSIAVPKNIYYKSIYRILFIGLLYLAGCLLFGIVYVIVAAQKMYTPLENVINAVSGILTGSKSESEISEIGAVINGIKKLKLTINSKQKKADDVIRNGLLSQLLDMIGSAEVPIERLMLYGIHFPGNRFAVSVFYLDDSSDLFFGMDKLSDSERNESQFTIISSFVKDLADSYSSTYFTRVDDMIVCIVALNNDVSREEAPAMLKTSFEKCIRLASSHFGLEIFTSTSPIVDGLSAISIAYRLAVSAIDYAMMLNYEDRFIQYSEVVGLLGSAGTGYLQDEVNLIRLLMEESYIEAGALVEASLYAIKDTEDEGVQRIKHRMRRFEQIIFSSMQKVLSEHSEIDVLVEIFIKVKEAPTAELFCAAIRKIIQLAENTKVHVENEPFVIKKIQEYINGNYSNPDMGLTLISDKFKLSISYISRLFKKDTGTTVLEYITKRRVEEAKYLLKTSNKSVKEIAAAVGYRNPYTLTRTMRKMEGILPVSYRDHC